jgi:hypothetical protein
MEVSLDLSRLGNRPSDSRRSLRTTRWSGRKVSTSSLRRKVERGGPVSDLDALDLLARRRTCQMRALDMAPALDETTKVPT